MLLSIELVEELLAEMRKANRPATVDWTNRTITVLSEVKTDQSVVLSDGPMQYRDKLFTIREKP